jgi:type I restriction enzyme M protein
MNLAIRGSDGQIAHGDCFHNDRFPELRGDYTLADLPFTLSDWRGYLLLMDQRWQFGVPPGSNVTFAGVRYTVYHLEPTGLGGFGLAPSSLLSSDSGEDVNIRSGLGAAYARST